MKQPRPRMMLVLPVLILAGCASQPEHPREQAPEWHPPVAMLLKYDANHDGTITRAEMEAGLRADFARADYKHLGCLDEEEARAVNEERWKIDKSTMSPLVDFAQKGCIDFDAFAATPRSLFDQLDKNGDGILTPDEIHPKAPEPPRHTYINPNLF